MLAVHPVLAYLRALRALDDTELEQLRETVPDLAGAADLLELAETAADHGQVQQRLRTAQALAVALNALA